MTDERRILMVAVGVGRTIGGGTPVLPDASVDDGVLALMVSTATGAIARSAFARDLSAGAHGDRDDVVATTGREVTIRGDPARHGADGEIGEDVTTRTYTIRPGAWSLIRP